MNPESILNELAKKEIELSSLVNELDKLGYEKCKTEYFYRTALTKELVSLNSEKVKVSIIGDLARGKEEIAKLRFKRDMAVNKYYICKAAIENKRLEIEVRRSQLTWLRAELTI